MYNIWKIKQYIKLQFINKDLKIECSNQSKKIFIFLSADYGNLGDVAITIAQKKFLESNFKGYNIILISTSKTFFYIKDVERIIGKDDIITIIGGGNTSDLYIFFENVRRFIIEKFKDNKIICFPQTISFTDSKRGRNELNKSIQIYSKHDDLCIVARELISYKIYKENFINNKILLTPDIVLSLKLNDEYDLSQRSNITVILRDDFEKSIDERHIRSLMDILPKYDDIRFKDTHIGHNNNLEDELYNMLSIIGKSKLVITDRLHGMIFCAITGTPCIVFSNNNQKIKGTYNDWLNKNEYIKFIEKFDINKIEEFIKQIYSQKNNFKLKSLDSSYECIKNEMMRDYNEQTKSIS